MYFLDHEEHVMCAGPLLHFCRCHALISSLLLTGICCFPLIVTKIMPQCVNLYILLFCCDRNTMAKYKLRHTGFILDYGARGTESITEEEA